MHYFTPFLYPSTIAPDVVPAFMLAIMPFFLLIMIWTIVVKGYALWHAARAGQKEWFIALLIINTLGILEVVYLVWFRPTSHSDTPAVHSSSQV